jgi:outer membrane biosynthesis protein TonB
MPSLETPPSSAPPDSPVKVRTGRFGELEEHELIHLLDSLDDERAKARFRESIYISLLVYLALGWFIFYGPRVLFHQPRLINPADVLKQRDREMTYLDMPKDISKDLPRKPTKTMSDKDRTQQTAKPTLDKKTLDQLQAMRRAGPPAPSPLPPTPQPAPAPAQQAPQQAQQPPPPQPQHAAPQTQAMVDAPHPVPTKPNFGNQSQSAGDAIRKAAQGAAQNRGGGGDYGANLPVAHNGLNTGVDVLSDTMGVDFDPYLKKIIREIYNTWLPLIPEEARPPLNKSGETLIRFMILPNGQIGGMWLDGSTHDDAINKAAWGSIQGVGQFPPLPSAFKGPNLELRIHYLVNKPTE